MRQLLLLRHAHAADKRAGETDRERPLTKTGVDAAAWAGAALRRAGFPPDLVLVSPARRTLETLQALAPWSGPAAGSAPTTEVTEALYLAPASTILRLVRDCAATNGIVLVIGHNPGLQELACQLAGAAQSMLASHFPPGGLARFEINGDWSSINTTHAVRLRDFSTPSGSD